MRRPHDRRTKPAARPPNSSSPPAELLFTGLRAQLLSPPPSGADRSRPQQTIQLAAIFFHLLELLFWAINLDHLLELLFWTINLDHLLELFFWTINLDHLLELSIFRSSKTYFSTV